MTWQIPLALMVGMILCLMGIGLPAAPRDDTVAEDVAAVGGAAEAAKSDAGDVK